MLPWPDLRLGEDEVGVDAPTCDGIYRRGEVLELDCELDMSHEIIVSAVGLSDESLSVCSKSAPSDGCCACGYDISQYDVGMSEILEDSGQ